MAGRAQQDSFMDDSDDSCPLCVEEFDLSDRSFRPCPCGYQVCQFCYNNIKNNMNGLCPACRRPYDDKNIQWKVISPEEAKADAAAQARKKAAARKQEADRRKEESQNRKHLAGLRVLQKNLVYIVGMNIPGSEDHVLETLRGPNHFGQYGPIIKIVVSKTKEGQPLGIYVTFANKDDAATCISALDGVPHEGRVLRAQYGTTKYCSAFLRNETCNNRNCMFLHETGEDSDSFSRQDLSSFNALSSQRSAGRREADPLHPPKHHVPVQQSVQSVAAAAPATAGSSKTEHTTQGDGVDNSALPNTASWAKNPQVEQSKKPERANNRSTPSPKVAQAKAANSRPQSRAAQRAIAATKEPAPLAKPEAPSEKSSPVAQVQRPAKPIQVQRMEDAFREWFNADLSYKFDRDAYPAQTNAFIDSFPPMIDPNGGAKRVAARRKQEERERAKLAEQTSRAGEEDELFGSGSLQLGGEPDAGADGDQSANRRQLGFELDPPQSFASQSSTDYASGIIGRSLTPQQQRNISLLKSANGDVEVPLDQFQRPAGLSQHQPQLSNPFQSQNQPLSTLSRHGRQSSRYTFANDLTNSSAPVKPTASTQMAVQQGLGQKGFVGQGPSQPSLYNSNYSNIQGPPPGLKSSGTPPISGGGMFGQGHGFTAGLGGQFAPKGNNDEMMRDLIRSRGVGPSDAGKLDLSDPSILQARMHQAGAGQNFGAGGQGREQTEQLTDVLPPSLQELDGNAGPGHLLFHAGVPTTGFPLLPSQGDPKTKTAADSLKAEKPPKKILPAIPRIPDAVTEPLPGDEGTVDLPPTNENAQMSKVGSSEPSDPVVKDSQSAGDRDATEKVSSRETQAPKKGSKKKATPATDVRTTSKPTTAAVVDLSSKPPKSSTVLETSAPSKSEPQIVSSPSQPATSIAPAPIATRQPRTLRLIQTTDVEAGGDALRRASGDRAFASPGTPVRDPEVLSAPSDPASRGPSPPPAKSKGKAQMKKEAETKVKAASDTAAAQTKPKQAAPEVVQAPIIGRKKKTKKPKAVSTARATTESLPSSPVMVDTPALATAEDEPTPIQDEQPPSPPALESDDSDQMPPIERLPSAASLISYLQKTGALEKRLTETFLDPPKFYHRLATAAQPHAGAHARLDLKLQPQQIAELEANKPVSIRVSSDETVVVLPNHAVLRYLTSEEANAYETGWKSIKNADQGFLSSSQLPAVYTMDAAWKECMCTPMAPTGYLMTEQMGHRHIAEQLSMSALGGGYEAGFYRSPTDIYQAPGFDPTTLATQMEDMTLEDAGQALKTAEDMAIRARKAMDADEKKLMSVSKKNRKALKE